MKPEIDKCFETEIEEIENYLFEKLGFCGCGNPESAVDLLREVLNILDDRWDFSFEEWYPHFKNILGDNNGLYYTYLYMLDDKGLTEHGCAVPGWLTDDGKRLKKLLNKYSSEEIFGE